MWIILDNPKNNKYTYCDDVEKTLLVSKNYAIISISRKSDVHGVWECERIYN